MPEEQKQAESKQYEIEKVEEIQPLRVRSPEIDMQVVTAKQFPRSVKAFREEAEAIALLDEETAASMSYALPRGGKTIEGPSVRLAEIVAGAWGNLRVETNILEAEQKVIKAQAVCWDLEKNVAVKAEVSRRIIDKYGRRYNEDMIVTTGNAAAAIAFRNAVFKIVPGAFVQQIRKKALKVAVGDVSSLATSRTKAMEYWHRYNITDEQILSVLGRESVEDVTLEDVGILRGFVTTMQENGGDVDSIFPPIEEASESRKNALAEKLARAKQASSQDESISKKEQAYAAYLDMCEAQGVIPVPSARMTLQKIESAIREME